VTASSSLPSRKWTALPSKVGNEYLNKKAQGKFCQISLTVKNIGDEAQTFDGSSQKAIDANGAEFSNDGTAEMYANQDNSTFLNEINPGNQTKGKVIFDVPSTTALSQAASQYDCPEPAAAAADGLAAEPVLFEAARCLTRYWTRSRPRRFGPPAGRRGTSVVRRLSWS
jgi:hypothetical protein